MEYPTEDCITGAFIKAVTVKRKRVTENSFFIKLSTINVISEISESSCLFWTYKDCCYFADISEEELKRAINSFIFEPETHYERYMP